MTYHTLLHELAPDLNPAGVDAPALRHPEPSAARDLRRGGAACRKYRTPVVGHPAPQCGQHGHGVRLREMGGLRLAACDYAIALPGKVVDLAADDDRGDLLSRIVALLATHDQCQAIKTFLRLHPWARDLKY